MTTTTLSRIAGLLIALCGAALPFSAYAAIAFGSITESTALSSSGSYTGPTVSGSNTLGVCSFQDQSNTSSSGFSVTWGGVSMTAGPHTTLASHGDNYVYYIKNPGSAASISISFTGSTTYLAGCDYYTGVDQTNPVDNSNSGTIALSNNLTVAVVSAIANDWLVTGYNYSSGPINSSTNTTKRGTKSLLSDSNAALGSGSNNAVVNSSSGSDNMQAGVLAIEPVQATATTVAPGYQFIWFNQ